MSTFIRPEQVMASLSAAGEKKTSRRLVETLLHAFLAGVYIAFASHLATVAGTGEFQWYGAQKILMGAVFSVGLILVVIPGAELFTGNILIIIPVLEKKTGLLSMVRNWILVWVGNLAGGLFLASLMVYGAHLVSGAVGETAVHIAAAKASLNPLEAFTRGIGANWLVCLGVWMGASAKDQSGKILGIFFPVMAFVAMGFEHAIANMYFLPAGAMMLHLPGNGELLAAYGDILSMGHILRNLVWSTFGNIVGGGVFVGTIYWYLYTKKVEKV